jgi:neutral ceramidase
MRWNVASLGLLALLLNACASSPMALYAAPLQERCADTQELQVGTGIYDVTGPAAQVMMGGYVMPSQRTEGIRQRLRSRAFVIASPCTGQRVAIVSVDQGMMFHAVKQEVLRRLRTRLSQEYSDENVLLSATHTHSGPSGFSHDPLYNLTFVKLPLIDHTRSTLAGFVSQNFEAIVQGIYESIARAHHNLAPGRILLSTGELRGVGFNRSLEAYERNPEAKHPAMPQVDERMTLLRLEERTPEGWRPVGTLNWFAVHPTSMSSENRLINGDNKGYASYLFEKWQGTDYLAPKTFVAAFAQSNEGDVSPNTFDERGRRTLDDVTATEKSGGAQYRFARGLFESVDQARVLPGVVDYRHLYVEMDEVELQGTGSEKRRTCEASLGLSMGAGTEDGRGIPGLVEGIDCGDRRSPAARLLCGRKGVPTCQAEKPVAVVMGTKDPPWSPNVLPLQLVRIGNLAIVAVPFEMTTVAGRRLRATVQERLAGVGVDHVVIAGLSNAYAGYLATREEYQVQHYEGASTHFGPWTLAALQQKFSEVADALRTGAPLPPGPEPRDMREHLTHARLTQRTDTVPVGERFGGTVREAKDSYKPGATVRVKFWGANPRNDLRIQGSFLEVQRRSPEGSWTAVLYDWDWETVFHWERYPCPGAAACSLITVEWRLPPDVEPGTYRILHRGKRRAADGKLLEYQGLSREFTVARQ